MTIYQAIYEVISPQVAYDVCYPFQGHPINLKKGYCTFYEITRKNITRGRREQLAGGASLVSAVVEFVVQINLERRVNYKEDIDNNAPEVAFKLQAYLKSDEALRLFDARGYELAPIWAAIDTDGYLSDDKSWVQLSRFDIVLYGLNQLTLPSEPLRTAEMEVIPLKGSLNGSLHK